ncbi:MAG: hypothetical protein IH591_01765, partial [Bacteroidales bacterium]|nr:hypothetical protein [Bacteroidales bacterium]
LMGQDYQGTDTLTLDGKECINAAWDNAVKKSIAVWSEDKTSLKVSSIVSTPNGDVTIVEVYKMDGTNLVLESIMSSAMGELAETMFYDKHN